MAQFAALWAEVKKSIGDRIDLDTEIKSAVNDATVDLGMMFPIRQLIIKASFTTETGVSQYELDTAVLDVIDVRNDTDVVLLSKGDSREYDFLDYANADKTGTPKKWFVDGNNLIIYNSTPDTTGFTISYRYLLRVADMSSDTDPFPLPRQWERPAKLLAKSYMFELLGQSQQAVSAHQQMMATVVTRKSVNYWEKIHSKEASVAFGDSGEDW